MKVLKNFRLSKEACEILDKQPNATQYLEDLILGKKQSTPLTEDRVRFLIAQELNKVRTIPPVMKEVEYITVD